LAVAASGDCSFYITDFSNFTPAHRHRSSSLTSHFATFQSLPRPLTPAAMEDFNSSDVELDLPPRNPSHEAGKASDM
jgi:hypothetical protein